MTDYNRFFPFDWTEPVTLMVAMTFTLGSYRYVLYSAIIRSKLTTFTADLVILFV